jgi:16S rRNA (cytosine1407-C5)-methyltransferase
MDLKPGDSILDLCAAPGSKTSEIAAITHNQAQILAVEDNDIRYQKLLNTLSIQGATSVQARHGDSTQLHKELPEAFDKILADVPCSAEGRIDLSDQRSYKYWSEKNIVAHAKLQRRLLRSAVACLKPGGTLVYSTCTLAPEENEGMVEWLITEFPCMKPVDISVPLKNSRATAYKSMTLLPSEEAEGFFVVKLKKS